MSKPKFLALWVVAAAITGASVWTYAGLTTLSEVRHAGHGSAVTSALTPVAEAPMNRLIIKFRQQTTDRDQAQMPRTGEERVTSLNAKSTLHGTDARAVGLSYLKSVTAQTHVALTSQRLDRTELTAVAQQLAQDPQVEYAEIDERVYSHFAVNDPDFSTKQWNLLAPTAFVGGANMPLIWAPPSGTAINGSGVIVATLDTGYLPHADLAANIIGGYDFISADSPGVFTTANDGDGRESSALDPGDWNANAAACEVAGSSWHGTNVAGIIGAVGNNGIGIIGVAYGAKILPVRALGVCGGYLSDIAAGMIWAAGLAVAGVPANPHAAKVINLSLGGRGTCATTYQNAIAAVRAAGSVVVASTGNDGFTGELSQPANCPGVIAVTAHNASGTSPTYANVGPGTVISAPGDSIYSTANTGLTGPGADSYAFGSGTSFASAHVAGLAALLFQVKPTITPDEVQSRLTNSARSFPTSSYCGVRFTCGAGLLDATSAVALVQADSSPYTSASADKANPVARGVVVHLTGVATPGSNGGTISTVAWTQISGPLVTLTGSNSATATFTTPATSTSSDTLVFKFTATNTGHFTSDSRILVSLAPYVAPPPSGGGSGGSGGGGGAVHWAELLALLILWLAGMALRRRITPTQPPHRQ
jgi:serine protease